MLSPFWKEPLTYCDNSTQTNNQCGDSLSREFFRHVGFLFVLVICVLQPVTSVDVVFHLPQSLALLPFDLSWIFTPLLQFCTFIHVATTTRALLCILKTWDVAHTVTCEKIAFLWHINRFVPSSPLTHKHMITRALGFAHTHTHTHTHAYMHTDVAFEGFDVGDASVSTLSCGETFHLPFFHECSECEFLLKLTVEFLSTSCMGWIYCFE